MKAALLILTVVVIGLPWLAAIPAEAAEFRYHEDRVVIGRSERINDDLYVAGGEITIEGNVAGDLIVAGGQVRVTGEVEQDVLVAGGQVVIVGIVGDDVRVAGGEVRLAGVVKGDVLSAGGEVFIDDSAQLGNVWAATGRLQVAGTTGSVRAASDEIVIQKSAEIKGDLSYMSDDEATIEDGATIIGNVTHQESQRGAQAALISVVDIMATVSYIVLAVLFIYVAPNKSRQLALTWRQTFGSSLLWGLLFLVAVPVLSVLLIMTVVGWPLGVGLLLTFPIFIYLGMLVSVIAVGSWIRSLWQKQSFVPPDWLSVVLGAVALQLLGLLPIVGWLALFLVFASSLGVLLRFDWQLLKKLRYDKVL